MFGPAEGATETKHDVSRAGEKEREEGRAGGGLSSWRQGVEINKDKPLPASDWSLSYCLEPLTQSGDSRCGSLQENKTMPYKFLYLAS